MHRVRLSLPFGLCLAIAGGLTGCDQVTKFQAVAALTDAFAPGDLGLGEELRRFMTLGSPTPRRTIAVLESFWEFRYVENPGFAFSLERYLPRGVSTPVVVGLRLVILVALLVWLWRTNPREVGLRIGLVLVAGGALGNLIDGARLGYVIDFVHWHWYGRASWPLFNLADASISTGVALLLLVSLLQRPVRKKATGPLTDS